MDFTEWTLEHLLYCKGTWEEAYHIRGLEVHVQQFKPQSLRFIACVLASIYLWKQVHVCIRLVKNSVPLRSAHRVLIPPFSTGQCLAGATTLLTRLTIIWKLKVDHHHILICRSLMCWHYREKFYNDHLCNWFSFEKLILFSPKAYQWKGTISVWWNKAVAPWKISNDQRRQQLVWWRNGLQVNYNPSSIFTCGRLV